MQEEPVGAEVGPPAVRGAASPWAREPTEIAAGYPARTRWPATACDARSSTTRGVRAARCPSCSAPPSPSAEPWAELWLGAHARAPSQVARGRARGARSAPGSRTDPCPSSAPACAERFGAQLPFLLKVLAVEQPLSLQVHPDAARAALGYAREEAARIPLAAPERCYPDPNPKPELVCALGAFEAFCGFRSSRGDPREREGARRARLRGAARAASRSRIAPGAILAAAAAPPGGRAPRPRRRARGAGGAGRVRRPAAGAGSRASTRRSPETSACAAPLLLHHVRLAPGEALELRPGDLHGYLARHRPRGDGELATTCCARASPGSTSDPEALLGALNPDAARLRRRVARHAGEPGEAVYPAPTEWFRLGLLRAESGAPLRLEVRRGAEVLLCLEGAGELAAADAAGRGPALPPGRGALRHRRDPALRAPRRGPPGARLERPLSRPARSLRYSARANRRSHDRVPRPLGSRPLRSPWPPPSRAARLRRAPGTPSRPPPAGPPAPPTRRRTPSTPSAPPSRRYAAGMKLGESDVEAIQEGLARRAPRQAAPRRSPDLRAPDPEARHRAPRGRGRRGDRGGGQLPRRGGRRRRRPEDGLGAHLPEHHRGHRREPQGDRSREGPLQGDAPRRQRVRQLDQPRPAGRLPPEPRRAVLDRGRSADEGRRQGEAHLPGEPRLRRARRAGAHPAGRAARLRGGAASRSCPRWPTRSPRRSPALRPRRSRRRSPPRSRPRSPRRRPETKPAQP